MGHSSVEHRLKADIAERHQLRNESKKKQSLIAKLTQRLESTKKKRLNNRYTATIKRLGAEAETLEHSLNGMNLDLQKRITDEMEFSEEEIRDFKEQQQKGVAEMQKTEDELKAIAEGKVDADAEETSEEESDSKEAMVVRTRRMLGRERRSVEKIEREIGSEERDKELFARELQQIMAELEAYEKK